MNCFSMPALHRAATAFILALGAALLLPATAVYPAQAQDSQPSQQEKAMHYSLYYESFKNDDFKSARSDLQWMLENAPGFPNGDDRNFERKFELYTGLAEQASGEKQRRAYLDTAATVLATAPQTMEEQGISYEKFEWEILRGRFLEEHGDTLSELPPSLKDPITHYRQAFELAPGEVNPYYIRRVLRGYLDDNKQQKALEFAALVDQKRGGDEKVAQIVASVRNDVFSKNPQAQVAYLEQQVEAHPDSTALLEQLFEAYTDQGNITRASELAPRLMESSPSTDAIREVAQMRLEDGRPEAALKAYSRLESRGASLTADDYFKRGKAYRQMNQLSRARAQFRKALQKKPDYGLAYIAIGDLYTRAVSECSGGQLARNDKAVYWAAVDKYRQAKQADPSVASTANSKIQTYRKYFPTQEDIFYRDDWTEGESFTIDYGCYSWIGETTNVRQAP